MNIKRYFLSCAALFAFIFIYETFVHGHLLLGLYSATPNLWRPFTQMQSYALFNIVIMMGLSLWLTFIFTRFFRDGGLKNGIFFGFYMGILSGLQAAGAYYYLPILAWFIFSAIESMVGGALIGALYREK